MIYAFHLFSERGELTLKFVHEKADRANLRYDERRWCREAGQPKPDRWE
jgi:hypothetical protein